MITVAGQTVRYMKETKSTGKVKDRKAKVLRVFGGHAFLSNGHIIPEHFGSHHVKETKKYIFRYYN